MRNQLLLILLIVSTISVGYAQSPTFQPVPAHLERIEQAPGSTILGTAFFYKERRLNSPFSVEIPLLELNDPIANRHFKRFRTWTTVGRLMGLASVAYVLFNRTPDQQTRRTIYFGSLVASVGFTMLSNHQVNTAVRHYNAVVGMPRVGLIMMPTEYNNAIMGVGMVVPFWAGEAYKLR